MRKGLLTIASIGALLTGVALLTSPAGGQAEGEGGFSFEIIKDVHGDGPTSGYVIAYECIDEEGVVDSDTLNFDNIVDGHETQVIEVDAFFAESCTVTEIDSNGADLVEYECEFFPGSDAPDAAADPEGSQGACIDGQSAGHFHNTDFGSFLVRNTFDPEVLPDDDEPPPAVNPDVVAATPSFTG